MRVLVACERSNIVASAFRALGHYVLSCDTSPNEVSQDHHYTGSVFDVLYQDHYDLLIAHPPCTFLCRPNRLLLAKSPGRWESTFRALEFVHTLAAAPIHRIAIENPPGLLVPFFRPYDDLVRPYNHGDPYRKEICLWLKNLPPLLPSVMSSGRKSMNNHTNGRVSQAQKSVIHSRFFPGVAKAMANQWSI